MALTSAKPAPRYLLSIRLSRDTETTTSPETQLAELIAFSAARGATVIQEVMDLDVSATKLGPMERPGLGPWLRAIDRSCERGLCHHTPAEPCLGQWDTLCVLRMDRFIRSTLDFCLIVEWANKHGKTLVSVSENLTFNDPLQQVLAPILAVLAQMEATRIGEKMSRGRAYLRKNGFFGGGVVPFGYRTEGDENSGHQLLVEDEINGPILRSMASMYLEGASFRSIAVALNDQGTPSPRAEQMKNGSGKWDGSAVNRILASSRSAGFVNQKDSDKPMIDESGLPIRFTEEPVLKEETHRLLTEAMKARAGKAMPARKPTALLDVAFCGSCKQRVTRTTPAIRSALPFYRCTTRLNKKGCLGHGAPEEYLLERVRDGLLEFRLSDTPIDFGSPNLAELIAADRVLGDVEIAEEIRKEGVDNRPRIAELEERQERLVEMLSDPKFTSASLQAKVANNLAEISAELDKLQAQPVLPDKVRYKGTGKTYRQFWEESDTETRRRFLIELGVKVWVHKALPKVQRQAQPVVEVELPSDLVERARSVALGQIDVR